MCSVLLDRREILENSKLTENFIMKNIEIKIDLNDCVYITMEKTKTMVQMQQGDDCSSAKIEMCLTKNDSIFNDTASSLESSSIELRLRSRRIKKVSEPKTKTTNKPAKISNEKERSFNDASANNMLMTLRLRKRKEENMNIVAEPAKKKMKVAIKYPKLSKNDKPVECGQIILAKMRSYAPWPAQVRKIEKKRCEVFFFGTNQT